MAKRKTKESFAANVMHNNCGACICCDPETDMEVWDSKYKDLVIGVDCCDPEEWINDDTLE